MHRVISVRPLPDFSLDLEFSDHSHKRISLKSFIGDNMSAPLKNWEYFEKVSIDDGGGITWPNGYDFCPEFLWHEVEALTDSALEPSP